MIDGGCQRIGKVVSGKPKQLLVRLTTETAASELLKSAPLLRRSSNKSVATNIYINPDLSPVEAKLAFEARQHRRTARSGRHQGPPGTSIIDVDTIWYCANQLRWCGTADNYE
jgi:hypothetical protein